MFVRRNRHVAFVVHRQHANLQKPQEPLYCEAAPLGSYILCASHGVGARVHMQHLCDSICSRKPLAEKRQRCTHILGGAKALIDTPHVMEICKPHTCRAAHGLPLACVEAVPASLVSCQLLGVDNTQCACSMPFKLTEALLLPDPAATSKLQDSQLCYGTVVAILGQLVGNRSSNRHLFHQKPFPSFCTLVPIAVTHPVRSAFASVHLSSEDVSVPVKDQGSVVEFELQRRSVLYWPAPMTQQCLQNVRCLLASAA